METKKHLIKLTPHDKFFFGGENTFGEGNQNYLVKSNYFPQQTGVLGFIRHQLLLQCNDPDIFSNNRIVNKNNKTNDLIGSQSFRINGEKSFEFGAIKSLSPVFICNKKQKDNNSSFYFPANKEYQYNENKGECEFLQIKLGSIPELLKYNPKFGGLKDLLINNNELKLNYNDVFIEHQQVGIRKEYEGGTNDKAYYMQTFLKFNKEFCFAFIVELEEKINDKDVNFMTQNITVFGGEQQAFKMEVKPFEEVDNKRKLSELFNELIPDYKKSQDSDKIVLVSDAFVEQDIINKCDFAITETVDFRFLETITEKDGNYYKKPSKSNKYNFYKKGSVFYGNTKVIGDCLTNAQFKKLGYNYFKIITKQQ